MPRLHCPKCHEINEIPEGGRKACDFCGFGHPGGVPPEPPMEGDVADDGPAFDPSFDPNAGKMPWDDDYDHAYEAYRQQMLDEAAHAPAVHGAPGHPAPVAHAVPAPAVAPAAPPAPEVLIAAPEPVARPPKHVQVAGAHLTIEGARLRWNSRGTQADVDIHHIDVVQTAPVVQTDVRALGIVFGLVGLGGIGLSYRLFGAVLTNTVLGGVAAIAIGLVLVAAARRRMFCVHAGDVILRTRVGNTGSVQAAEAADEIMAVKRRLISAVVHAPPEELDAEEDEADEGAADDAAEEGEGAGIDEVEGADADDEPEAPASNGVERPRADDVLERLAD